MKSIDSIRELEKGTKIDVTLKANAEFCISGMVGVQYYAEDFDNETNIPGRHIVGHYGGKPHPSFEGCIPLSPDWNVETGERGRDIAGVHLYPAVIEDYSILEAKK